MPPVDCYTAHYSLQEWSIYTIWWNGQKIIMSKCRTLLKVKVKQYKRKPPICDKSVTTQNLWFFRRVQQRHNCSSAAIFANCVMTLHLLEVHLQTFLSIPLNKKCQILSCDTLVTNERYMLIFRSLHNLHKTNIVLYIKCLRKLHYISKNCLKNKVTTILKRND